MRALKLRYAAAAITAVVLSACDDSADKARKVANEAASKVRETADMGRESAQSTVDSITSNTVAEVAPSAPPPTVIDFDEYSFDFGTAPEGAVVTHNFRFMNTGNHPLVFSDAEASCSCIAVEMPDRTIDPGHIAVVTVHFDSKNRAGQTKHKVTLTANTNPPQIYLYLTGQIDRADESLPQMPQ